MKKYFLIPILSIILFGCSKTQTPAEIRDELLAHKEEITKLEAKLLEADTVKKEVNYINVSVKEAVLEAVKHNFSVTGNVAAENYAYITPEMNGQIKKIHVVEGQNVSQGQILVTLNSSVISASMTEVRTALRLADTLYQKQKKLWEQKVGREIDYLQAKNQKESLEAKLKTLDAQLAMSVIKAPISGIIDQIYLNEGELASPGRQLIDLVNMAKLEIKADVSEEYVPTVNTGDSVIISFPTYPGIEIKTIIHRTSNIINPANRTFKIVMKIDNINNKIKPNMIANIMLTDYKGKDIIVPSIIVKNGRQGDYVFIAEDQSAKIVPVETSLTTGNNTIISKGIKPGDKIIIEGYNQLSDGSPVQYIKN